MPAISMRQMITIPASCHVAVAQMKQFNGPQTLNMPIAEAHIPTPSVSLRESANIRITCRVVIHNLFEEIQSKPESNAQVECSCWILSRVKKPLIIKHGV